ncbi:CsgG/HfaB family protein [Lacinutrix sp.]|uniref:CsgG/HfaB family protein n=1 Tax=Lacinutrix sp. TaxID=1937692 RepID=UPI00262B210F|nr:CsgG/HfaB family protein [Lacinutrix sp.]MDG1714558.1 CsgG/HfaB family protein [Lacinutrix sp.]
MKLKLTITLTLLLNIFVFAQKKSVAITSFETISSNVSLKYVKAIEDKVKEAFYATNRFDIVDRTNLRKLKAEKELQKSEDFIDGKTVQQSSLEGAEQIVTGSISQVDIVKNTIDNSDSYDCKISFSLQVIDIATGQVLASELIRPKQSFIGGLGSTLVGGDNTPEKAFFNSLKGTQKAIDKFVGKHFPVTTLIIEITEASSNKAKSILINTGNLNGAKNKQEFTVFELINKKVGGKTLIRKKELGQIKITKVEGDEISEAKVVKGGEAIFTKFNSGAKIECHSKN